MRISDWSSDVCSSDLGRDVGDAPLPSAYGFDESYTQWEGLGPRVLPTDLTNRLGQQSAELGQGPVEWLPRAEITHRFVDKTLDFVERSKDRAWFAQLWLTDMHTPRSEEHTSELQSLMRISYAVFCLKKKNNNTTKTKHPHITTI